MRYGVQAWQVLARVRGGRCKRADVAAAEIARPFLELAAVTRRVCHVLQNEALIEDFGGR